LDNFLFIFILSGAIGHVIWNILLKQSDNKILFTRSFTLLGSIILFPVLFLIEPLPRVAWPFFVATMIIHVFYKLFLCKVYDYSGLSYGYPISRGLPSLIILMLTPIFFEDDLSFFNKISVFIISLGILLLVFAEGKFKKINLKGLFYSLIVATIIVSYSIIDAKGARASNSFIYLLYYFALDGFVFNLIAFFILKKNNLKLAFFKKNIRNIFIAASCSIYSYMPAVYGFTVGKVAVVAALREVSILFASFYGLMILKEKGGFLAFLSAVLIVAGCGIIKFF